MYEPSMITERCVTGATEGFQVEIGLRQGVVVMINRKAELEVVELKMLEVIRMDKTWIVMVWTCTGKG